ncbi:MAG: hypothetical protein KDA77_19455, partial [Planctomycetaceae bacterium]|nr:hypothetical protein [Planctomycetaceae bacterium]
MDHVLRVAEPEVNAGRSVLKNEVQMSRLSENVAETRAFFGADFLSACDSSPEPVVFSRATRNGDDPDVRDGVKRIFFKHHSKRAGELQDEAS